MSLLLGGGVGVLYALCGVRSPAPPVIALLGLLGMVAGEQAALAVRAGLHRAQVVAPMHDGSADGTR